MAQGAHTLLAKAYDTGERVGTSTAVEVDIDNTPPDAALTSPTQGMLLRDSLVLEATANDTSGVARVEFWVDDTRLDTDFTPPYSVNWTTGGATEGAHALTVHAVDSVGNVGISAPVHVTVDNIAPTTALGAPAQNARRRGTVQLSATAHDNQSVAKVEFYVDGTRLGTVLTPPYLTNWVTVFAAEGAHVLTVKAFDGVGHVSTSAPVSVTVDNTAPAVALGTPAQNAALRGTVQVSATASDNQAVARVEFYAGQALIGTATTEPYRVNWDTATGANGVVTLSAKAYDPAGNVTSSTGRAVSVDNAAPSVAITSPAQGASLFLSTTVQANASDNVGVTQVVFYDGTAVIGTDTTAPYSVSWNLFNVPKGSHTLTAKAHDAVGNITTSVPISVKVN